MLVSVVRSVRGVEKTSATPMWTFLAVSARYVGRDVL